MQINCIMHKNFEKLPSCLKIDQDESFLLRETKKHPRFTSDDLKRVIADRGVVVSSSTVRRRLLKPGRKSRRPVKKTTFDSCIKEKEISTGKKL